MWVVPSSRDQPVVLEVLPSPSWITTVAAVSTLRAARQQLLGWEFAVDHAVGGDTQAVRECWGGRHSLGSHSHVKFVSVRWLRSPLSATKYASFIIVLNIQPFANIALTPPPSQFSLLRSTPPFIESSYHLNNLMLHTIFLIFLEPIHYISLSGFHHILLTLWCKL